MKGDTIMSELGIFYPSVPEEYEIETLSATENITYTAEKGKAWNEVSVNVPYNEAHITITNNTSSSVSYYGAFWDGTSRQMIVGAKNFNANQSRSIYAILPTNPSQARTTRLYVGDEYKFTVVSGNASADFHYVDVWGDCTIKVETL